ncbi:MAG: single-stranded-DNA-specific exonuclease RecJ [Myxococcota bacterium]|jgi:single-stranded-DNA-specific exonuclease
MQSDSPTGAQHSARWVLDGPDESIVDSISEAIGVDRLIARLIARRGVVTPDEARKYYRSELADLSSPDLMKDMPAAVDRIVHALKNGEKICIYGDYDVDGVTSVAIMLTFLKRVSSSVTYYIPARAKEGYGLNIDAVTAIAEGGSSLITAVDCGISSVEEVAHAKRLGVDMIVVDHHQVSGELPEAVAVLNPHRPDCQFPFKDLAAVGVAFFLLLGLRKRLRETGVFTTMTQPNLRECLDLVVLGTVADVVPLLGDNRILVKHGLKELSKTKRPGLIALKEVAGATSGVITARTVGFGLAPRLNAAGRLEDAKFAVELVSTGDMDYARNLAEELNWQNARRQKIEEEIYNDVDAALARDPAIASRSTIVMASESWHPGVIGIVASRIARRFYRPTILICVSGDRGRGSGRSIDGFHMFKGIEQCGTLVAEFGGHRAAAGLTIEKKNIPGFIERFEEIARASMTTESYVPRLELDAEIDPGTVNEDLLYCLEKLEPHGTCNPAPMFLGSRVKVLRTKLVGQGHHLKLLLQSGGRSFDAICFGLEPKIHLAQNMIDIAFSPEFNDWMGQRSIQFRVQDLRQSENQV